MTRPLRILVDAVNDNVVPRGPDRYLIELAGALRTEAPDLDLVALVAPWQARLDVALAERGIARRAVTPPRGAAARVLWHAGLVPGHARAERADVLWLPNLIWVPRAPCPMVVTAHDLLHFRTPEKFGRAKSVLLRGLIRRALGRADRVIAVSEATAADARAYGRVAPERLRVVPNGGPPADADLPAKGSAAPRERMFLYVGQIERTKGVVDLVTAFRASRTLAGWTLELVGPPGNASDEVARTAAGDPRIHRRGAVSDAELGRLYRRARAFVFPSEAEGFGLVLLEAMARGTPVIAADATALPEVVGDAGLLVPPRDPAALRAGMERLATDEALAAELARRGLARVAAFTWPRAAAATAAVLREVAR